MNFHKTHLSDSTDAFILSVNDAETLFIQFISIYDEES